MANAVAKAKYLRIAPRKMRLVADLVRGRKVVEAKEILNFTPRGGAPLLKKVLDSAVANAESKAAETRKRIDTDGMVVREVHIDGGFTIKRMQPGPRGRRCMIRKRTSHVMLIISD